MKKPYIIVDNQFTGASNKIGEGMGANRTGIVFGSATQWSQTTFKINL
jgi:hypothetical protein